MSDQLGPLWPERAKATMSYALISERAHKALKRYRCIWCGEQIPIGTRYVREFSVYDGDVQKHTWHPECKGAAEEFFCESGEDEFAPLENERPLSHAEQEFQLGLFAAGAGCAGFAGLTLPVTGLPKASPS